VFDVVEKSLNTGKEMRSGTFRLTSHRRLSLPMLGVLFGVSFCIPFFAVYLLLGGGQGPATVEQGDSKPLVEKDPRFPEAFVVRASNTFLRVRHSPQIQPATDAPFLFAFWMKPVRLPSEGERITIVSKVDSSHLSKRGFSLSLYREGDQIFPLVWWQNTAGQAGGMYRFAALEYTPDSWILLALSYRDSKFLGLHSAFIDAAGASQLNLLGGYELESVEVPLSESDLLIGARGEGSFRGRIGPLLVTHQQFSEKAAISVLEALVRSPRTLPSEIDGESLGLWAPQSVTDLSSQAQTIDVVVRGKLKTELVQSQGIKAIGKKGSKARRKKGSTPSDKTKKKRPRRNVEKP
jgi:hypothetical protein